MCLLFTTYLTAANTNGHNEISTYLDIKGYRQSVVGKGPIPVLRGDQGSMSLPFNLDLISLYSSDMRVSVGMRFLYPTQNGERPLLILREMSVAISITTRRKTYKKERRQKSK